MKAALCGFVCLALAAFAGAARAIDDHLLFAQDGTGAVSATLAGTIDPCRGSRYFPMGVPTIALTGREYDITSPFAIIDPLPCPDVPSRYEVTAPLGTVADGHYTVVWTLGAMIITGTFDVSSGVLLEASPVPALSLPMLAGLVGLLALVGFVRLREQRATRGR